LSSVAAAAFLAAYSAFLASLAAFFSSGVIFLPCSTFGPFFSCFYGFGLASPPAAPPASAANFAKSMNSKLVSSLPASSLNF